MAAHGRCWEEILQTVILRVAVISSVFSPSYVTGGRLPSATIALPSGACYWRQGSLINQIPTGATQDLKRCRFVVRDPEFLDLLGPSPKIVGLVKTSAHEGGAWYPDKNELYFSSQKLSGPSGDAKTDLKKVNLATGAVTVLSAPIDDVPNGMVLDNEGNLLVCQQGSRKQGGFIQRIDLRTGKKTVVADNWFGVPFNSPNDAVVKRDGSIWFTDPNYGSVQGFRSAPKVNNQVYRISVSGVVDAVADGFSKPNGLAFSHNEKRLYVTDTGFATGWIPMQPTVVCFGGSLRRKRSGAGNSGWYQGRHQGACLRRHRGWSPSVRPLGKPLGLIRQPGVANMGFARKGLDTTYMLNDTTISYVKLKVKAAGLKYASMN